MDKKILLFVFVLITSQVIFCQYPGNVSNVNMTAWFKPDALVLGNLTTWTTTYPAGAGSITVTDGAAPYPLVTNIPAGNTSNYNTTVEFTANSLTALKGLQNTSSFNLLNNSTSTGQGTFFSVYYLPTNSSNNHMMLYNETSNDAIQFRNLGANGRIAIGRTLGTSSNACRNWGEDNIPTIISYKGNRSGFGTMQANENSNLFTTSSASQSSGPTGLYFGFYPGNANSPYNGYLSEFIFYNRDLTLLEMNKIHSYLAVKYGITLDNTGGGTQGDYLATDGTIIWDASVNPTYHNDVIGIGRDDDQALLQKQSHSFDDVTRVYVNTLGATNVANTGTIAADTSYLVMGNTTGVMCATATANLEVPTGTVINSRLEREWKVTKTNFAENISIDFTLDACATDSNFNTSCLALLVDDDGDFTNSTVYDFTSGITFSVIGNIVTVSGITTAQLPNNNTRYLTLGSVFLKKELGNDTTICSYSSLILDAGNAGANYLWNDGSTNQTLTVQNPGTYSVRVYNNFCEEFDTIVVSEQEIIASFDPLDTAGCTDLEVNFRDLSTINSGMIANWAWNFGDGNRSVLQNPGNTFVGAGQYSVTLEVTSGIGCVDDTTKINQITVYAFAVADFEYSPAFTNTREPVTYSNYSSNASSFKWYFGDGDSSTMAGPTHEYLEEGLYEITLIAINEFGCNDTIVKTIEVKDELFFVPNSFTPHEEGKNPMWGFVGLKQLEIFQLQVYDRWGEVVFESNDPEDVWDGTHEGEICPAGVYVWSVRIKFQSNKIVEKIGHVNLLR